jgi:2,4-dichlorophenol 6-monooxygenase
VADGTTAPPRDPTGTTYHPTTRPGHRLPHAWIQRDGKRVSTHDLIDGSRFVLITGEPAAWVAAVKGAGTDITVEEIDESAWRALSQIEKGGAVLVRPDGHIGWRAKSAPIDRAAALKAAIRTILAGGL